VMFTTVALVVLVGAFAKAHDETAKATKREADRLAIEKLTQEMIKAFDRRDAAAIDVNWTQDGEFIRNDGEPVRGRTQIQNGYVEFFKTLNGKPKLEIQSDAVRFPSTDMAVSETTLRLKNESEAVASGRQETVWVREAGHWKVAAVREWDRNIGLDVSLKELGWLIGAWHAAVDDRTATITYEWDENKAFIRGRFAIKQGAEVVESGTEIIGKDNAAGVIRSWFFQSDGGFGGGVWTRDGKKWSIDLHGVRADGDQMNATISYLPVGPTAFTWRATNQTIDGATVPDSPPVKVTKQKSAN
jgi:uncharacterized protein (TIGR02246 family)